MGIPKTLVTDNGKQFDSTTFRGFCEKLGINLQFALVVHPQNNRKIEITNRTICKGLKKRLDEAKDNWAEELHSWKLECLRYEQKTTIKKQMNKIAAVERITGRKKTYGKHTSRSIPKPSGEIPQQERTTAGIQSGRPGRKRCRNRYTQCWGRQTRKQLGRIVQGNQDNRSRDYE
ncbi:uncharacterized protein LOC126657110 [Mercurialis annua]|uniref:uncharacterized protein LOC126657110 n=1 Tax=Mercurialis annua TaxID=3986 RepID=UPI00216040B4|nr:uncharacterized protein LOC126657110 [Mercurialis annua]